MANFYGDTVDLVPYADPGIDWSTAFGGVDAATWAKDYQAQQAAQAQQQGILDQYIANQAAAGKEFASLNPYNPGSDFSSLINYGIYQGLHPVTPENVAQQTGQVFRFETGGTGASGDTTTPVVFQPGQNYTLTDSSGKTIGTASSAEEMQNLVSQANDRGSWNLYQGDVVPGNEVTSQTNAGSLGSMLLPMAVVAALPFAAQALGAFAPASAGATAEGISPAIAAAMAKDAAFTAGLGSTAAGISSGLASGALTAGMTIPELTALGSTFGGAAAPAAAAIAPAAAPAAAAEAPIVVSGAPAAASHLPAWAEAFAAPAISSGITASMLADAAATAPAATPSLLDQILKYGSLASLAVNGIGSLLGGSSGTGTGTGTTTPYTSVLGPTPTFGRGAVQPFTGNYETYGQGPEWNFFAPQPTTGG